MVDHHSTLGRKTVQVALNQRIGNQHIFSQISRIVRREIRLDNALVYDCVLTHLLEKDLLIDITLDDVQLVGWSSGNPQSSIDINAFNVDIA